MATAVIEKEIGSKIMLYDPQTEEIHILNPTARLIYAWSKDGRTPEEIAQALRSAFKATEAHNLAENIATCQAELRSKGLIP
jgi:hypothetical protein